MLGKSLCDLDWVQARLLTRFGGLGLRSALATADAAYFASRTATYERCTAIYPEFAIADYVDAADPLSQAIQRINTRIPDVDRHVCFPSGENETSPPQQQVMRRLFQVEISDLHNTVGP